MSRQALRPKEATTKPDGCQFFVNAIPSMFGAKIERRI